MRNKLFQILPFLALSLWFTGCGNDSEKNIEEEQKSSSEIRVSAQQFQQNSMELGTIENREFPQFVRATGVIDVPPENKAMITTFAEGYVKNTYLLEGDQVKKGQLLVSLENPKYVEMQQDYLETREQMDYLESEYQRQETLYNEQITSEKNYLRAKSEYNRNKARYNALRQQLQMLHINPENVEKGQFVSTINIYSPISGQVSDVMISKGTHVSEAQSLMQIIDTDHIHVELSVFEKDLGSLEKGQPILVTLPENSRDTLTAEVHLIGASINPEKRTVRVHGHFEEDLEKQLAVGMYVDASIITSSRELPSLPSESITDLDGQQYVLQLDSVSSQGDYYLSREKVKTGQNFNNFQEIENAEKFKSGTKFLVTGAYQLLEQ
ncbi:MAG: efflux RND transporter periplasmic adaptor subunit [Christiangramia sp.]|nr:efflux transporter periplasmic adaptor subunit [Christiangramia sp.]|tara:strand:- start:1068 stop:2210 length:1143 start_codon:yes stop_codon:yes gene_type:complete